MEPFVSAHRVYWGTVWGTVQWAGHECELSRGHVRPCECHCGEQYKGGYVHGEDASTAVAKPQLRGL